jgi:hypothetical protein
MKKFEVAAWSISQIDEMNPGVLPYVVILRHASPAGLAGFDLL